MSPALAGGFLSTGPPGKSLYAFLLGSYTLRESLVDSLIHLFIIHHHSLKHENS